MPGMTGMDDDEEFKIAYGSKGEINDSKSIVTFQSDGNTGIGISAPEAKLSLGGISSNLSFGKSAIYIDDSDRYFDFYGGMIFRGTGGNWTSRFTGTSNIGSVGEILGIYKSEGSDGGHC